MRSEEYILQYHKNGFMDDVLIANNSGWLDWSGNQSIEYMKRELIRKRSNFIFGRYHWRLIKRTTIDEEVTHGIER